LNFLAHLYLSSEDDELMIGNFIADSVKGSAYNNYPIGIRKGILLHRAIDSFTDSHAIVKQSVLRLRPAHRKFSGVIVDIFYDHFLALRWNEFSEVALSDFAKRVHVLMLEHKNLMPVRSQHFLQYMVMNNIPLPYAEIKGIEKVLFGMSRRSSFENTMHLATADLVTCYADFENEFRLFFPEIITFCQNKKSESALQ